MNDNKKTVVTEVGKGEGFKVRIFDLDKGLTEYDHVKIVRIVSKDYNLLIMEDYLSIIGDVDGSIDIKGEDIDIKFPKIRAFYMNSKNVFNLMIKEVEE